MTERPRVSVIGLHHVQIACPTGSKDRLRRVLQRCPRASELPKPDPVGNRVEIPQAG